MKANQKIKSLLDDENANTAAAITAVILLIVGFAVAGLLFTFTTVLGGQTYNLVEDDLLEIHSYSDSAVDTITLINGSYWDAHWESLGNSSIKASSFHIYVTANATEVTSYVTLNATDGTVNITLRDVHPWLNDTACYANYSYDDGTIRTAIQKGILSNFEAQQQIGDYMPIIALAIIITIVIGLIIGGIASKFMGPMMMGGYSGDQGIL